MCFFLALVHLYLLWESLIISGALSQDSKCSVPDATTAAVAAMTTGLSGSERNSWLSLLSQTSSNLILYTPMYFLAVSISVKAYLAAW